MLLETQILFRKETTQAVKEKESFLGDSSWDKFKTQGDHLSVS